MFDPYAMWKIAKERQKEILELARRDRLAEEATRQVRQREEAGRTPAQRWTQTIGNWLVCFVQSLTTGQRPIL